MFWRRAALAFTLGPAFLYLIYLGGAIYFSVVFVLLNLCLWEYIVLIQRRDLYLPNWLLFGGVWTQLLAVPLERAWSLPQGACFFGTAIVVLLYVLWGYEKQKKAVDEWAAIMGGIFLLGWLGAFFFRLRGLQLPPLVSADNNWRWCIVIFMAIWSADSWAFVVGNYLTNRWIFGRHPLAPRLSPKKTVEGFVGSIILGTLFTLVLGCVVLQLPFLPILLLGITLTSFGTAGDLAISLIKREVGVKDSGRVFGSHGGALDRIDSLLWCIPLAYYLLHLLIYLD